VASEVDHLSDVILPTVRDSSIDDLIDDAVNESPNFHLINEKFYVLSWRIQTLSKLI
jgi:hypothetical protein